MDILIGKKKAYIYSNIAIQQLNTEPQIKLKARGRSILTCVDAFEILKREIDNKRQWTIKYVIETSSSQMKRKEQDNERGDMINISELEIIVNRT